MIVSFLIGALLGPLFALLVRPTRQYQNFRIVEKDLKTIAFYDLVFPNPFQQFDDSKSESKAVDILELPDPFLHYRLRPSLEANSNDWWGPHDLLGFRNDSVPNKIDTLILGDSFTYGFNVAIDENWPSVYQKLSEKTIYNVAVGSWAMLQFHYMIVKLVDPMRPSRVILAPYFGNDLYETQRDLIQLPEWKDLRSQYDPGKIMAVRKFSAKFSQVNIKPSEHRYFVDLSKRFNNMDLTNPGNQLALNFQVALLKEISSELKNKKIQLIVAPIPTKELLLSHFYQSNHDLDEIARNENQIFSQFQETCRENEILFVDSRKALIAALESGQRLYPDTPDSPDSHFNATGYKIFSQSIFEATKTPDR